jgi:hypothetical protein
MRKSLAFFMGPMVLVILCAGLWVTAQAQTTAETTIYLPIISKPYPLPPAGEPGYCLTADETHLAALINDYRQANNLPAAPLSRSLSMVAQWHVYDLQINKPNTGTDPRGFACNLHSWSNQGNWTPVCYTDDHTYASGMWFKPNEITNGIYQSHGFEIAIGADDWTALPPHMPLRAGKTARDIMMSSWKKMPGQARTGRQWASDYTRAMQWSGLVKSAIRMDRLSPAPEGSGDCEL